MKRTTERERLTRFCKLMTRVIYGDPDKLPKAVRQALVDIPWDTCPIAGIRMAANDIVEQTQDLDGPDLKRLDSALEKAGAATLSQLRDKGFQRVIQLLSWRVLKKDEDIYLMKAIVDNQDQRFSKSDLVLAQEILERSADAT